MVIKKSTTRSAGTAGALVLFMLVMHSAAWAIEFPYNALRWITHSAAGSGSDVMIRMLATPMSESLGQHVAVENHPGSSGHLAAGIALKASSDGHTWLAADNGILVLNPARYKSLPYEKSSLLPLGLIARAPLLLVTSPQAGFKSAKDLLDSAKTNPNKFNYASVGMGSPAQLAIDLLSQRVWGCSLSACRLATMLRP